MKRIGFIGVGVMGKSMVYNLMKNGYQVSIYSRTKSKVQDVIEKGAVWFDTAGSCAAGQDAVITMVGYPKDVEEVYCSEGGILDLANEGTYLIDMTTTSPKLSKKIWETAASKGLHAIDAPVSGGDVGAREGTLSIMAGGEKEDFETCLPILQCMGTNIVYEGKAGSGQHTKMANQIALAGAISGVCEALAYGKREGLCLTTMLNSISKGAAGSWQMSNMAPRMLEGDFEPGFFIKHYTKDLKIASEEAEDVDLELFILKQVQNMYEELEKRGYGNKGTQALIHYYEE